MAEKSLRGINFPGLPGTYMVPEIDKTLTKEGAAAEAAAVGERFNKIESYGIGKDIGAYCSDCNEAIYNGWYYISKATTNKPEIQDDTDFSGAMFVVARWAKIFQTIYITISGEVTELIRNSLDSGANWSEWEWKNPPMTLETEYATIERFGGQRVYVKRLWLYDHKIGDAKQPGWSAHLTNSKVNVIDCSGSYFDMVNVTDRYYLPAFKFSSGDLVFLAQARTYYNSDSGYTMVTVDINTSAVGIDTLRFKAEVIVKYTK